MGSLRGQEMAVHCLGYGGAVLGPGTGGAVLGPGTGGAVLGPGTGGVVFGPCLHIVAGLVNMHLQDE